MKMPQTSDGDPSPTGDTPDQHGFVMMGVETLFLDHLAMFRRGSTLGYTRCRFDAARADDGTLIFSGVVRAWIEALARRRGCRRATGGFWPFGRWRDRRRSAVWPPGTG